MPCVFRIDYYRYLRKLLFILKPELAHTLTLNSLALLPRCCFAKITPSPRVVMGIEFPNRVGLAAGLDKNGDYLDALAKLGFGFIEIGTVTPKPQTGNAKPRLFRLPSAQALINRMGFNNKGVDYVVARLQNTRYRGIVGVNIGKNLITPVEDALGDYIVCLQKVYPYASYVAVNISSPNTPGLRDLQSEAYLQQLLSGIKQEQRRLNERYQRYVPVVVKIAPDLGEADIARMAGVLQAHGIDGVIATNTTSARTGVRHLPQTEEAGGLSGRPLGRQSTLVIRRLRQYLPTTFPVIGVGGIMSGEDALEKLNAGASLVQVYTGLIYRGPGLIQEIVTATASEVT